MKAKTKKMLAYGFVILFIASTFSYIIVLADSYSINPLLPAPSKTTMSFSLTYPEVSSEQLPDTLFTVTFN